MATLAMDAVIASAAPRFSSLIHVIQQVRQLVATAGYQEAPTEAGKAAFVASLRSVLPDDTSV